MKLEGNGLLVIYLDQQKAFGAFVEFGKTTHSNQVPPLASAIGIDWASLMGSLRDGTMQVVLGDGEGGDRKTAYRFSVVADAKNRVDFQRISVVPAATLPSSETRR